MSDTPTPVTTTEKTVIIERRQLCRLWIFTIASLSLNALILIVFLICAIVHHHGHHKHHHRDGGHGGFGGREESRGDFGRGGQGFHRFGGMGGQQGWGQRGGGFGSDRQGFRGNGFGGGGQNDMGGGRGPGRDDNGGPGMRRGGGFGMRGGNGVPPDPAKMTDMIVNRLSTQLTLTDDEKAKIKPIILDQATQMQKDMEAQRLARQKAMEDTKAKIKALLTVDQQKQLDAMQLPGEKPADASPAPAPGAK